MLSPASPQRCPQWGWDPLCHVWPQPFLGGWSLENGLVWGWVGGHVVHVSLAQSRALLPAGQALCPTCPGNPQPRGILQVLRPAWAAPLRKRRFLLQTTFPAQTLGLMEELSSQPPHHGISWGPAQKLISCSPCFTPAPPPGFTRQAENPLFLLKSLLSTPPMPVPIWVA